MNLYPMPFIGRTGPAYHVEDVFRIVVATGANLQAAIDNTGLQPDLIIAKNIEATSNWIWRNSAVGLAKAMASNDAGAATNFSGYSGSQQHIAYLFKRQKNFLDVIGYSGDGVAGRLLPHALKSPPGLVIVKGATAASRGWFLTNQQAALAPSGAPAWFTIEQVAGPQFTGDSRVFPARANAQAIPLGADQAVNALGEDYVAFAFGGVRKDWSTIQCGQFVNNAAQTYDLNHGWPEGVQFVMLRPLFQDDWGHEIFDTTRSPGWATDKRLSLSLSNAQDTATRISDDGPILHFSNLRGPVPQSTYEYMIIRAAA